MSIHSQDMEQNPNSDVNQVPLSVANLRKTTIYNSNVDLVNNNVYAKFGQFRQFVLKILSKTQILS